MSYFKCLLTKKKAKLINGCCLFGRAKVVSAEFGIILVAPKIQLFFPKIFIIYIIYLIILNQV